MQFIIIIIITKIGDTFRNWSTIKKFRFVYWYIYFKPIKFGTDLNFQQFMSYLNEKFTASVTGRGTRF